MLGGALVHRRRGAACAVSRRYESERDGGRTVRCLHVGLIPGHERKDGLQGLRRRKFLFQCPLVRACAAGRARTDQTLRDFPVFIGVCFGAGCPNGTHNPTPGASSCLRCEQGKYQPRNGQSACILCGTGNYSSNVLSCESCRRGEFCEQGVAKPERCPAGFTTIGRGAGSINDCGCNPGTYEQRVLDGTELGDRTPVASIFEINGGWNRTCFACPLGTVCRQPSILLRQLPVAAGYWRQTVLSTDVRPCYTSEACIGGTNMTRGSGLCTESAKGMKDPVCMTDLCAPSQRGPYCAVSSCCLNHHAVDKPEAARSLAGSARAGVR